ncbi:MAG: hypothetical protein IPN14_17155 [Bacteroidetes bacterium]|nr:hypothetical protein [Bacteroidota bacterium]
MEVIKIRIKTNEHVKKNDDKEGKIPGTGDSTPPVDTTIMNHGDLIPPQ